MPGTCLTRAWHVSDTDPAIYLTSGQFAETIVTEVTVKLADDDPRLRRRLDGRLRAAGRSRRPSRVRRAGALVGRCGRHLPWRFDARRLHRVADVRLQIVRLRRISV